jgi:DNA ligase-1
LKQYPDVTSLIQKIFASDPELHSFIIDSEIVAIDPVDGTLKTFQELSNRARKDVQIHDIKVAVAIFAFDLMYIDGEASSIFDQRLIVVLMTDWPTQILLEQPFRKRRALLRKRLTPFNPEQIGVARFDHVASCESRDGRESVEDFWVKAVESRCEGLMIKVCAHLIPPL